MRHRTIPQANVADVAEEQGRLISRRACAAALTAATVGIGRAFAAPELYKDPRANIERRITDLLQRLTVEEKVNLCHGNVTMEFPKSFKGGGIPRLGIGQLRMLDGRQGIRPVETKTQTTALPCTLSLSCTWNLETASEFGALLARELLALDQHVLLAPCMNLMRSPLGGRNFENLGEDPLLAGRMASAYIQGAQKIGVAGCSAILVANDYEAHRHYTSSNMDERTLREMHLLPFELSIAEGRVWTIMAANNLYNGVHIAANRHLLQAILKDKLGFDGVILTDWRAAYETIPTAMAGTDMTTGICAYVFGDGRFLEAVRSGQIPQTLLDEKVSRILRLYFRTGITNPEIRSKGEIETPRHRTLARRLAAEGMVLLKNNRGLLPVDPAKVRNVVVTGPGASVVPAGGGSGAVKPPFEVTPWAGIRSVFGDRARLEPDADAKSVREADLVLYFALDTKHGEGTDRVSIELPNEQAARITELAGANPNLVVTLLIGGPVSVEPWADKTPAILAAWYAGQSTGDAIADVLTGKVNPSAKLSCTFGRQLKDYACHALGQWPPQLLAGMKQPARPPMKPEERIPLYAYAADYKEGVFMGYRWFDEHRIEPRFPFGHGLSYTIFKLSGMKLSEGPEKITVSCTVMNTGTREGAEVVQLYVAPPKGSMPRPPRELKGFARVSLQPGERRQVRINLRPSALAFFDAASGRWKAEAGRYEIQIGKSSRDIQLRSDLKLSRDRFFNQL